MIKRLKSSFFKLAAIVLPLVLCANSCEKDKMERYAPDCSKGNCVNVNIRGSLRVRPSGDGFRNIPVEIYFLRKSSAWIPARRKIVSGRTNRNGEFDFRVTIDTKTFEEYS